MADLYNSQLDAFALYHKIQESSESSKVLGGPALPALGHAIAGSTGAAISNVVTYPLDLIITRLQIQRQLRKDFATPDSNEYKSIQDAAQKIYSQEGGIAGLYTGVMQDTSKTIADSFLFFLAYNFLRQSRLRSRNVSSSHLPVHDELSVGFLAGAFAKFLTTPVANIVTRKQTSSMLASRSNNPSARNSSVRSIASQIHSEKGLQGFWSGYSASLVLTLNPSLTFLFYETFKRTFLPRSQRSNPPPRATFLLAAISKAIASSITYPFSLAKTRAQISSKKIDDNDIEVKDFVENRTDGKTTGTRRGRKAARSTVFSTILHIARTEGLSALYEGLIGEVLKGFFSHGITMIVKEAVHKLIIQLYYAILKLMKKYPSPSELAGMTKAQTQQSLDSVKNGVNSAQAKAQDLAQRGSNQASDAYESMKAQAQQTFDSLKSGSATVQSKGQDLAQQGYTRVSQAHGSAVGTATSVGATVKSSAVSVGTEVSQVGAATYEKGKDVAAQATTNVNKTTDSVADYVGRKTEGLGRAIRPDKGSGETE